MGSSTAPIYSRSSVRVWPPDAGHRAVLREIDQSRGRSPAVCVKTAERTDRAVRARAVAMRSAPAVEMLAGAALLRLAAAVLRRPATTIVLAVSPAAWTRWRRRLLAAVTVGAAGAGVLVAGVLRGDAGLAVGGSAVAAVGWWLRVRAWLACWVASWFHAEEAEILVARVHPAFADEARRIYLSSIVRQPRSG